MDRLVFRHLSGSRAHQIDEFPLAGTTELVVGRDPSAAVKFDPERDDLVGRQHARIARDAADPYKFTITDLNSRNGTFVNRQRVTGAVVLAPGDVIQLGPGGPEVQFDLDPLPPHLVKATRLAEPARAAVPATREAGLPHAGTAPAGPEAARPAVGKATVERIVTQAKAETRRSLFTTVGVAAVVLAAVLGAIWWQWQRRHAALEQTTTQLAEVDRQKPWTADMIASSFGESTVFIEVGWKLVLAGTGEQIYHEYVQPRDKAGRPLKDEQGQEIDPLPVYVELPDGSIEPSLALDRGQGGHNQPIGGRHSGSGFVVTSDGFILTNRHVAASWETSYQFPARPGLLFSAADPKAEPRILREPPARWVPAAAKLVGRGRPLSGKNVEGSLTYMDVTFARNKLRFPATIARVSDRADVAMIKVNTPQPVRKVELNDNYESVKAGQAITIMGYPGVSPEVAVRTQSEDPFSREAQTRTVPDPTVTPGSIGRVIRGQMKPSGMEAYDYMSSVGDAYQLAVDTTGGGNSGGPVFDDHGRVIALYTWGRRTDVQISFAVPIRYGMELMSAKPVL
jgi:S1-C subfamily serine protease